MTHRSSPSTFRMCAWRLLMPCTARKALPPTRRKQRFVTQFAFLEPKAPKAGGESIQSRVFFFAGSQNLRIHPRRTWSLQQEWLSPPQDKRRNVSKLLRTTGIPLSSHVVLFFYFGYWYSFSVTGAAGSPNMFRIDRWPSWPCQRRSLLILNKPPSSRRPRLGVLPRVLLATLPLQPVRTLRLSLNQSNGSAISRRSSDGWA